MSTNRIKTTSERILTVVDNRPVKGISRRDLYTKLADENPESVARRVRELLASGDLIEQSNGSLRTTKASIFVG